MNDLITQKRLKEVLRYDRASGAFTWRVSNCRRSAGEPAGNASPPYLRIRVDGRLYYAHRLAVLYVTGKWPEHQVDHKDGNSFGNAYKNLRNCTHGENQQNRALAKNNTTGYNGVQYVASLDRYKAIIQANGRGYNLGLYKTAEAANAAHEAAKARLHGFQPVHRYKNKQTHAK